jgi:ribonuclease HII
MGLQNQFTDLELEAGCDEAGRGCLAGPVFAAAVILKPGFYHPALNDSKQVSKKDRDKLRIFIEKESLCWSVACCSPAEIDNINILNASILAMQRAVEKLSIEPQYLLIDGNRFKPYKNLPHSTMIKGDARFANIAAASILAKTHRDAYMEELHKQFPVYGWNSNFGYPTPPHRKGIEQHGPCEHHRMSFQLLKTQLLLF